MMNRQSLPTRIQYRDATTGELAVTEVFYGEHEAEVQEALLRNAGHTDLIRYRDMGQYHQGCHGWGNPYTGMPAGVVRRSI
ncbi:MAG: hypothetical protein RLZZ450_77 [Pseudomonadota bacterium]|jgi:hypothetical protein